MQPDLGMERSETVHWWMVGWVPMLVDGWPEEMVFEKSGMQGSECACWQWTLDGGGGKGPGCLYE